MVLANENYIKLSDSHYIEDIEKRVNAYKILHPNEKIYRIGAISPSLPLPLDAVKSMQRAVEDLSTINEFRGYGPAQGYDFLIDKILKEYRSNFAVSFEKECVFVSSGSTTDLANITNIVSSDNIVAIADTIDPAYENTTVLNGHAGKLKNGKWSNLVYLQCNESTNFLPQLPTERVDVIFLSNPNNVTGTAIKRSDLKRWVDYAAENESLIIYDASFQAFIKDENIPGSIYEIKGAKKVAIEIRSFSKDASFAAVRCGFTIVPNELQACTFGGKYVPINRLWKKLIQNYTNGVSYISQRGAEALFTRKSKTEISELVNYYMINASLIREELNAMGYRVFGGQNSPYIWFKIPNSNTSWKFFLHLLHDLGIVGTPGIVFGPENDRYMRFSGYCNRNDLIAALKIMKNNF
ncbi:MAG: LL-diaminopimelate aminotransferase [Prevotellaceae bacterium]|jgi:LL-diaminopimelate aminotransferase|nr:LL-diaminopimelate aminotransferase [Prevotellaceae bacterium]